MQASEHCVATLSASNPLKRRGRSEESERGPLERLVIYLPSHFQTSLKALKTKIEEILQTGELRRIKYENTEDVAVTRLFQGIYGVGMAGVSCIHMLDDGCCL